MRSRKHLVILNYVGILSLYYFLFCFSQSIHAQVHIMMTTFTESACFSTDTLCKCTEIIPIENENIKIIQYYTEPISTYDSLNYCFSNKLIIYNQTISLDSVYLNSIKNKDLVYKAGFVEGCYIRNNEDIILYLYFINMAINSSKPTTHMYKIQYNIRDKKPSIHMIFIEDW